MIQLVARFTNYSNQTSVEVSKMNQSNFTEFFPQLQQKGYTLRECVHGKGSTKPVQVAPDWFKGTYEEYTEQMHDFLNGL